MADSYLCSGLAQIFRTGWEVRGIHSIFDYVVGTQNMIHTAGKTLANWHSQMGPNNIGGGMPPCARDIMHSPGLFDAFVDHLFCNDFDTHVKQPLRELLVCSLLRHWDDFIKVLDQHGGVAGPCGTR